MKTRLKLLLSIIVSSTVMWTLFLMQPQLAPVLENPQHVFFEQGGDAWKNIYTVAYHTVHDEGLVETQAFNYPDGEHIAFADGQPMLTWILKFSGVDQVETVFAIVQLLPFLGCIFGAVLLTWLLLRLRMPLVYAILFGIGIALLSPQMPRATGHFGLSYVFALPLMLHLLLTWSKERSWQMVGWIVVSSVFLGQFHLYLLAECLLLASLFMLLSQVLAWKGSGLKVLVQVLSLGVVSFLISKGLVDLTWPIADRPAAPYGLKAFTTTWEELIIDRSLPWWEWFNEHLAKIRKPRGFESRGYLGIITGGFVFYLIVRYILAKLFFYPFRNSEENVAFSHVVDDGNRKVVVVLSLVFIISFILASGIWLNIPCFELVLDRLGAIRQFRSLGRFIWVGYYAIQISTAVVVTSWCLFNVEKTKQQDAIIKMYAWKVVPVVLAILLIWEGNRSLKIINANPAQQQYAVEDWADAIGDPSQYQAILPLPYFHEGSENYSALSKYGQAGPSTFLSLKTGLPNMGVKMSRQSLSQSLERLGINMPWVNIPEVLKKLDKSKPIIILVQRLAIRENLSANSAHDYKPWFKEVDTLYMDDDALVLSFLPSGENLKKVRRNYCSVWKGENSSSANLKGKVYANALSDTGWVLWRGNGIASTSAELTELHRWKRPPNAKGALDVHFLAYIGSDGQTYNTFELRSTNVSKGETILIQKVAPAYDANQYIGDWAHMSIEVPKEATGSELSLWGEIFRHPAVSNLTIRNVVVVPADSQVIWDTSEGRMKDGFLIPTCD